jgi:hypothetical protein
MIVINSGITVILQIAVIPAQVAITDKGIKLFGQKTQIQ